jgi:hypothetical protein
MAWQDTPKTTGWGGRRTGAGRKRSTEDPLHARELRLTLPQIAFLNRYGHGNLSAGARRLIDAAIERERDEEATRR